MFKGRKLINNSLFFFKVQHKGFLCRDNYKRTGLKCSLSLAHFHQSILMEICWSQPENHGLYIKQCKIFSHTTDACHSRFYVIKMTLILSPRPCAVSSDASEAPTVFEWRSLTVFTRLAMLAPGATPSERFTPFIIHD